MHYIDTRTLQARRSPIQTLRAKVDVMQSGTSAAWYARFVFRSSMYLD